MKYFLFTKKFRQNFEEKNWKSITGLINEEVIILRYIFNYKLKNKSKNKYRIN